MKTVCVYHSIDLDGWMSAAIVKHWFNSTVEIPNKKDEPINTLDFIGYNYGQSIPDLSEYDRVIMCDISFPNEDMEILRNKLTWIDHHISALNQNGHLDYDGIQRTDFAACELTWSYFFPNETMPEIVRLLGLYDSFRHKGTDEETKVLEFQYGARQYINNIDDAYDCLRNELLYNKAIDKENLVNQRVEIWNSGISIYQYLCTESKQTYKNGFEIRLFTYTDEDHMNPHRFICINKERFNPINFGIDYHKDGYDGCASFYFDGQEFVISLYNDNGLVDCSAIAKELGGGGHRGASGFRISPEGLTNFLRLNR